MNQEGLAIRVRHLSHRFGPFQVLDDVTFDVPCGEIFGFIGPNGAGKTTTIRAIATLLEPMAGRVEVLSHDVTVYPEWVRRHIGYMPDHPAVYERVTVREYLEFFADAYRVPTAGRSYAVVDAVMELVGLSPLSEKLVHTMSKGMKQRLSLARTLLHDPDVLILDEPASDLDPRARIDLRDLLFELRSLGKTIFLSSHILTELSDVCSSVAILERGRLVYAGSVQGASTQRTEEALPPRLLRIRIMGSYDDARALLLRNGGVRDVEPGPSGSLRVRYVGDENMVAELVRALVLANIGVLGVEPDRNALEQVFLDATRGELA